MSKRAYLLRDDDADGGAGLAFAGVVDGGDGDLHCCAGWEVVDHQLRALGVLHFHRLRVGAGDLPVIIKRVGAAGTGQLHQNAAAANRTRHDVHREAGLRAVGGPVQAEIVPARIVIGNALADFIHRRPVTRLKCRHCIVARHHLRGAVGQRIRHRLPGVGERLIPRLRQRGGHGQFRRGHFHRRVRGEIGRESAKRGEPFVLRAWHAYGFIRQPGRNPRIAPRVAERQRDHFDRGGNEAFGVAVRRPQKLVGSRLRALRGFKGVVGGDQRVQLAAHGHRIVLLDIEIDRVLLKSVVKVFAGSDQFINSVRGWVRGHVLASFLFDWWVGWNRRRDIARIARFQHITGTAPASIRVAPFGPVAPAHDSQG